MDDRNEFLYFFEYSARSKKVEPRGYVDLRRAAENCQERRAALAMKEARDRETE